MVSNFRHRPREWISRKPSVFPLVKANRLRPSLLYRSVETIRKKIESSLYSEKLKFLTAWDAAGEAHVTTITPVEYQNCMWSEDRGIKVFHMNDIERLALDNEIQSADLEILGIGLGQKKFEKRDGIDSTHFLIIRSEKLGQIRQLVFEEFLAQGGDATCWDPAQYFPHVTIGYTYQDIHFPDVEKDLAKSQDLRFELVQVDK